MRGLLVGLFALVGISTVIYADTIDIDYSSEKIALGETLTVSYSLSSNTFSGSPDFSTLEKDFQITSKNVGKAISVINGQSQTQYFWRLALEPKHSGEVIVPAIQFGTVASSAHKITIDTTPHSAPVTSATAHAFLQADISTSTPYAQSQVIYTLKLFYQSQLTEPHMEMPQLNNVSMYQLGETQTYQTSIKDQLYNVVEMNFAFFPKQAGVVTIPAAQFRAITYDSGSNPQDNVFLFPEPKQLNLASKPFTLNVQRPPASFSGSTWLPAKKITLTEVWSAQPPYWEAGTPVVRHIAIEAVGLRADQIPDPMIEKIPGMNIYADHPKRDNHIQSNSMVGVLEQQITYIPSQAQTLTLPAIVLNWWNVTTNHNEVARLAAITTTIKGGGVAKTFSPPPNIPTVSPLKTTHTLPTQVATPFYQTSWFWLCIVLFAAWLTTLKIMWRKNKSPPVVKSISENTVSASQFKKACQRNDSVQAQQFLLAWGKKEWPEQLMKLGKLRELVAEPHFQAAIHGLEQAIYAKNATPWEGTSLYNTYQQFIKKHRSRPGKSAAHQSALFSQPLPPLHPQIIAKNITES